MYCVDGLIIVPDAVTLLKLECCENSWVEILQLEGRRIDMSRFAYVVGSSQPTCDSLNHIQFDVCCMFDIKQTFDKCVCAFQGRFSEANALAGGIARSSRNLYVSDT